MTTLASWIRPLAISLPLGLLLALAPMGSFQWLRAAVDAQSTEPVPASTLVLRATAFVPLQTDTAVPATTVAPATATPTVPEPSPTTAVPSPTDAGGPDVTPDQETTPEPTEALQLEREERPIIVVEDFSADPARPGAHSTFRLKIRVANVGEHLAENVQLTLGGDAFLAAGQGTMLFLNKLEEGDDKTLETDLRVAATAQSGVHSLSIALRWDDSYGGSYSDQTSIGIEVGGGAARPSVVVTAARLPGRVAPGAPFTLALDLLNTGGSEARNVLVVPTGGPLAPHGSGSDGPLFIPAGGAATLSLRVIAAAMAQPGATAQTLELRYDDPGGERYTESQTVGLVVTGDAAASPMPIVASYTVDPAELHPGQVFELELELVNEGATDANHVRLILGGGASSAGGGANLGVFAPLETSNVRFLGRLAAGGTRTVGQKMVVHGAAKPGVYVLEVGIDYVDVDGQARQDSQVVSLLVSRKVGLEIRPLEVVTSTVVGQEVSFSVEIINKGSNEVNVTNVEVQTGRYMDVEDGSLFIGPMDGGGLDVLDATLLPVAPTEEAEVKVVVQYIDDFNREQQIERTFEMIIEPAPERPVEPIEQVEDEGTIFVRIAKGLLGLGASPPRAVPRVPEKGRPERAPQRDISAPASAP